MKRRSFLKSTIVASATGAAVGAGILSPNMALAAGDDVAAAKSVDEVLKMLGASDAAASSDIKIKAPEIAENGAVVPVTITSSIAGTTGIVVLTAANPTPFSAKYTLGEGTVPLIKSRFKMGKTTDVVVLVKADGKFYTAKANVKVTKGGCGG